MKILISPAKSIDTTKYNRTLQVSSPIFLKESSSLVSKLKKMKPIKLAELMHVSMDLAELNVHRYQNWNEPVTISNEIIPSIFAFQGEVYRGLNVDLMSDELIYQLNDKVRILSGLYGILKPLDLIYPYRLEMGTKWSPSPSAKNLYQFWGNKLTKCLKVEMSKNETLVNLASNEYAKAIDLKQFSVITPVFKEYKNGSYKMVMMYAKHARGAMARYIVENNIDDVESLKLYNVDGYQFDVNQSTSTEWVFTR